MVWNIEYMNMIVINHLQINKMSVLNDPEEVDVPVNK